jgi:hypothetical protein
MRALSSAGASEPFALDREPINVAVQPRGHYSTGYARTAEASTW